MRDTQIDTVKKRYREAEGDTDRDIVGETDTGRKRHRERQRETDRDRYSGRHRQ